MPTSSTPARPAGVLKTRIRPRKPIAGEARNACRLPLLSSQHTRFLSHSKYQVKASE
jgi:hypothetical protein